MNRFKFHRADEFESGERDSLPFPRGGVFGCPEDRMSGFDGLTSSAPVSLDDLESHLNEHMNEIEAMLGEVNRDLDEADRLLDGVIAHISPQSPWNPAA